MTDWNVLSDLLAEKTDPNHPLSSQSPSPTESLSALVDRLESEVVGQRVLLEKLVIALVAGGHVLVEGVPGLAKTRAVRSLAQALDLPFRRVQFTPDLLPADLTGTQVYLPATGAFEARPGPIVTSILLADEINRAPAKVQAALLEAMQEGQVTIGDVTIVLPFPFWVMATQNPIEHEGTYPLPEAQLDRFLLKLTVDYPTRESELQILNLPSALDEAASNGKLGSAPAEPPLFGPEEVARLRSAAKHIHVADAIREYVVDLVRATRTPELYGLELGLMIELGAGPRASIAPIKACAAHALLAGRGHVTPHDVKTLARDVLRHRVLPSYEADAAGLGVEEILTKILDHIRIP